MAGTREPGVGPGCVVGSIVAEQNRLRRLLSSEHFPASFCSCCCCGGGGGACGKCNPRLLVGGGKWNKKILFKGKGRGGGKLSAPYRAYTVPAYIKNASDCTLLFMAIKSSGLGPQSGREL